MGKSLTTHLQTKSLTFTNKKWPAGASNIKNCLHNRQAGVQVVLALKIDENII